MTDGPISPEQRVEARIARRRYLYGESGKIIGESHHNAKLSDHEVMLLIELFEEGYSVSWLAEKFECHIKTARSIVTGRTRSVTIARVEIK